MEFPQELLFTAIESEKLGESFGGDGADSIDDLLEERERLAKIVSSATSEAWGSATDIAALQSNVLFCLYFLSAS